MFVVYVVVFLCYLYWMNIRQYRDKCYKIAKVTATYLVVKRHISRKIESGRLTKWHEINDDTCLLDIFFADGGEIHDLEDIIAYEKSGIRFDWPKMQTKAKDLFSDE